MVLLKRVRLLCEYKQLALMRRVFLAPRLGRAKLPCVGGVALLIHHIPMPSLACQMRGLHFFVVSLKLQMRNIYYLLRRLYMKHNSYKAINALLKVSTVVIFALMPFTFLGCDELINEVFEQITIKGKNARHSRGEEQTLQGRPQSGEESNAKLQAGTTVTNFSENLPLTRNTYKPVIQFAKIEGDTRVISYKSSKPDVATVDATGRVTFNKAGFTIITATKAATAGYQSESASYALAIQGNAPLVKKPQLQTSLKNVESGTPVAFTKEQGHTYDIVSDTKGRVSIDENASTIEATGAAEVWLLATQTSDGSVAVSEKITFDLAEGTRLKFDKDLVEVEYKTGSYRQEVTATSTQKGKSGISYESSDKGVATVDGTGNVSFKKGGTVVITATKTETNQYKFHSASYTLIIEKSGMQDPDKPEIDGVQGSWKIARKITNYDAKHEYRSNTNTISIVNGKVKATEETSGTISVRKRETDTEKASEWVASKLISFDLDKGTTLEFGTPAKNVRYKDGGYKQAVTKNYEVTEDTGGISYKSNDKNIAIVDGITGKVSFKKNGTVTITAEKAGIPKKYRTQRATYTLIITSQHPVTKTRYVTKTELIIGSDMLKITSIDDKKYSNFDGGNKNLLTKLSFDSPSYVTTIGFEAFAYNNLKSLTIPNSVTEIGYSAFQNNKLKKLTIPNSVTEIDYSAFKNNKLENLTIPNSIIEIGSDAFKDNEIETLTLGNSVTYIGRCAVAKNKLKKVTIPKSVTDIRDCAFTNNPNLTEVTLSETLYKKYTKGHAVKYKGKLVVDSVVKLKDVFGSQVITYQDHNGTQLN